VNTSYEGSEAFRRYLLELEKSGKNLVSDYEVISHRLQLTRDQGEATIEEDVNERGHFHVAGFFGPANTRKIVDFILALPPEPPDEEPSHVTLLEEP